jgi:hypothetical protein
MVEVLEVWSGGPDPASAAPRLFEPSAYAFLLKSSALAARAEAEAAGIELRIAQAPVSPSALEWQRALWEEDSAAYIDILPLSLAGSGEPTREAVARFAEENLRRPPAAELWTLTGAGSGGWSGVAEGVRAAAAGVAVALVAPGGETDQRREQAGWIVGADRLLSAGYAPAPAGSVRFLGEGGEERFDGALLGRFFSDASFSTLLFYSLPGTEEDLPRQRIVVDSLFVRNPRLVDPLTGRELRVSSAPAEGGERGRVIRVAASPRPWALRFEKPAASEGFELPPEEVETTRSRELTAEEIIARHQAVREIESDTLERWTASARIEFHFKFALGGPTIDVAVDSNYFWERGGDVEWEQTDYFIQGNRVTWKNIPQLPYIQPEMVGVLPLDLTLDKTYDYRLAGIDEVKGREAYVLEFSPADSDSARSLYRGRVWIDRESFVQLKTRFIQTNMVPPVLSNEELNLFREETAPGGESYRLLDRIDGQQLWTIAGRNLVVRREVTFLDYEVNAPREEFERKRNEAYASKNQMLRQTDEGYRYLDRQKDGTRVVNEKMDTDQIFAAAGAFKDESTDGVTPLLGANYFNYDLGGKNVQLNVLFGGVLALVNVTKPGLFGSRADLAVDFVGLAIKTQDKLFAGEDELVLERVRRRGQTLSVRLGHPAGQFFKFTLIGTLRWQSYFDDPDAQALFDEIREDPDDPRDLNFILPPDHTVLAGSLLTEFNRRGYTVSLRASRATRSDWGEWGLFDYDGGSYLEWDEELGEYVPSDPAAVSDSFSQWGVVAFKEWNFRAFQKFQAELNYLDGRDLDRFSRYEFSQFGADSLAGFAGSGIRFDRGAIARAWYGFNILDAVRFNAGLESAWVEQGDSTSGVQRFTGFGLSGNVVGPWKTVISLSYGYGVGSDIPEINGKHEFFLLILKLF